MIDLATTAAAFVLGTALARANSCTVASARRLVCDGRADWLLGLGFAIAWAGLTMTAIALALPRVVVLPAPLEIGWQLIAGGAIMGVGATLNMGCFLGSVAGLGRGDLGFALTLAGIALALALVPSGLHVETVGASGAAAGPVHSSATVVVGLALFVPPALFGLWRWWQRRQQPVLALVVVGIAGGTVYACNPDWSYTSGLARIVSTGLMPESLISESGALAVVAGVVISAMLAGQFLLRVPGLVTMVRRLGGGALMATGAMLVPGGNDTLMLWAIPGLTLYGVLAYAIMIGTIMALIAVMQYLDRSRDARAGLPVHEQQPVS